MGRIIRGVGSVNSMATSDNIGVGRTEGTCSGLSSSLGPCISGLSILLGTRGRLSRVVDLGRTGGATLRRLRDCGSTSSCALGHRMFGGTLRGNVTSVDTTGGGSRIGATLVGTGTTLSRVPASSSLNDGSGKGIGMPSMPNASKGASGSKGATSASVGNISVPGANEVKGTTITFLVFSSFTTTVTIATGHGGSRRWSELVACPAKRFISNKCVTCSGPGVPVVNKFVLRKECVPQVGAGPGRLLFTFLYIFYLFYHHLKF